MRDEVVLSEVFAANGYRTSIAGKWHLGDNYPARPQDRGFQHAIIHGGGGIGQTPDFWGNDYVDDHYQVNGKWQSFQGYCTDVFFREAVKFIERPDDRPFFVYLPTNVPHGPYIAPEPYERYYVERNVPQPMAAFYGMIEHLDGNVGRLLQWLEKTGRNDNTIVVFMSDNGTAAGIAGSAPAKGPSQGAEVTKAAWSGFNAGMRAAKGSPYEGGHRVPCFIRWPAGGIGGGRDVNRLAAHFDILPTLVELCGLQFAPPNPLDGRSLVPLLLPNGEAWPDRTLFVHTQRQEIPPQWINSAVMTQRWRLLHGTELYDLPRDPGQRHDVAAEHEDIVRKLRAKYEAWWSTLVPSFDKFSYIVVGSEHENPVRFTCMDWHAPTVREIPWNQPQIDALPAVNGWWMLDVAAAGTYAITLRHKPAVTHFPLRASRAWVRLGKAEATAPVPAGATEVTLKLEVPAGPARFDTALTDPDSGESRGAFFVAVERLWRRPSCCKSRE